ncbi:alkaline phosphatase D domain protein, partial [Striga asiatica]
MSITHRRLSAHQRSNWYLIGWGAVWFCATPSQQEEAVEKRRNSLGGETITFLSSTGREEWQKTILRIFTTRLAEFDQNGKVTPESSKRMCIIKKDEWAFTEGRLLIPSPTFTYAI